MGAGPRAGYRTEHDARHEALAELSRFRASGTASARKAARQGLPNWRVVNAKERIQVTDDSDSLVEKAAC
jgi:alkylated DNA nucleotide flippase Atl1